MGRKFASRTKMFSRKIIYDGTNSRPRSMFLDSAMEQIGDLEATVSSFLNKIELEIFGSYEEVSRLIDRLEELKWAIYSAFNADAKRRYHYLPVILQKINSPPINLRLFQEALLERDYTCEIKDSGLLTDAPYDNVVELHHEVIDLVNQIPRINKDVRRFLVLLSLKSSFSPPILLNLALEEEIINTNENGHFLTKPMMEARNQLLSSLAQLDIKEIGDELVEETDFADLFFEGGKIVFMSKGEEIDETDINHSFYDTENQNENTEDKTE